jgi:hypothetical protein
MFWVLVSVAVIAGVAAVCIAVDYLLRRPEEIKPDPAPGSRGTVDSTGYLLADQGLRRLGWRVRDRQSKRQ